jgi:hypothetical protein
MTQSSIAVTSNVYVRSVVSIEEDHVFLAQIRGREAINLLLQRLAPNQDLKAASRRLLTVRQVAESAWQAPCSCGAYPEGPVRQNDGIDVQFRCPMSSCASGNFRNRLCMLDVGLVERATETLGRDIRELVTKALAQPRQKAGPSPRCERRPVPIRLSLFQDNVLTDADVEDALRRFLEDNR